MDIRIRDFEFRLGKQYRVGRRELATQLGASYTDDEGHRAGHWRSPSRLAKACFPLAVDWACPYRGNRESGRRGGSSRDRESAAAEFVQ